MSGPLSGSSHQVTQESQNRRCCDVNLYDNDHFVSTSEALGTALTPWQRRARNLIRGLAVSPRVSPGCRQGAEARRAKGLTQGHPAWTRRPVQGPTHAPGGRVEGASSSGQEDGRPGREPRRARPDPGAEGPPHGRASPVPPAAKSAPSPLTALRGIAIGRVRLNVDVLHARNASAQDGAHGHDGPGRAGPAGTEWDGGGGGSSGVFTQTWPGAGRTDASPRPPAEASASEPHPRLGRGRRDGSPPPPVQGTSGNGVPSPPRAPG